MPRGARRMSPSTSGTSPTTRSAASRPARSARRSPPRLRRVAAADRDALLLHAWAELTYTEIAHATGVPVGTVRSRIHRARTQLRAHLEGTQR